MKNLDLSQQLIRAIKAHKLGDISTAKGLYEAILDRQPQNSDANHNLGVIALKAGSNKDAINYFKAAIFSNKDSFQYWFSLINALVQSNGLAEAERYKGEFRRLNPTEDQIKQIESLFQKIKPEKIMYLRKLLKDYQYEKVIDEIGPELNLYPFNEDLYSILGSAHGQAGNFNDAILAYIEALKINPKKVAVLNNIGNLYVRSKRPSQAEKYFRRALSISPDEIEVLNNLGICLLNNSRYAEAIDCFEKVLKLNPNHINALNNLSDGLRLNGKVYQALVIAKKSISLNGALVSSLFRAGLASHELGKLQNAISYYEAALKIEPECDYVLNGFGAVTVDLNKAEKGLYIFDKCLKINPDSADAKINLLETLKITKGHATLESALGDLDHSLSVDPNTVLSMQTNVEVAEFIKSKIKKLMSTEPELLTVQSQIYNRNGEDLNCKRHKEIFEAKRIIPKFCFDCYKVQIDTLTIIDHIILVSLLYNIEFDQRYTSKCMIELRENIPGFYKGIIYCKSLEDARCISNTVVKIVNSCKLTAHIKIKHGCSEYPLEFPQFELGSSDNQYTMGYPIEWESIEAACDRKNRRKQMPKRQPSKAAFCAVDFLIIHKWLDYAKGLGDPWANFFTKIPIKYKAVYDAGKERKTEYKKLCKV